MIKKVKGKIWFDVFSPEQFGNKFIASVLIGEPKKLIDKKIETKPRNLMTGIDNFYLKLIFRIIEVNENAKTEFFGFEYPRDYITRMVRRRSSKIDLIMNFKSIENKRIKMKIMVITFGRARSSVISDLKKYIIEIMNDIFDKTDTEVFINEAINGILEKEIKKKALKIFPLRFVLIKKFEIL